MQVLPRIACFNGAATFRSRKELRRLKRTPDLKASMGPRPFGRGRYVDMPAPVMADDRFNGAATFRSRKDRAAKDLGLQENTLQWGRDLSVAEGVGPCEGLRGGGNASMGPRPFGRGRETKHYRPRPALPASMGPRPFGRGRCTATAEIITEAASFNGAATFRSRKEAGMPELHIHRTASMGPRPFGRGR